MLLSFLVVVVFAYDESYEDLCRFLREAQWSVLNEALKDAFGQLIPSLNRHLAMLAKQKLVTSYGVLFA